MGKSVVVPVVRKPEAEVPKSSTQLKNIEQVIQAIRVPCDLGIYSSFPLMRLPGLRRLEINLALARMFSWFTAPLLEHLHIHGNNNINDDFDPQSPTREK